MRENYDYGLYQMCMIHFWKIILKFPVTKLPNSLQKA